MAKSAFPLLLSLLATPTTNALILPNNVGKLPALGWNSWNAFRCDITEQVFLDAATKLVDLGLKDAGYVYVNVDDCWSNKDGRDPVTNRLVPNATRFPDGIKGLADKVHEKGLLFGIYSSAGNKTCAGYPASLGYEEIDAETWAEWGVDYMKYDGCGVPSNWLDECDVCTLDGKDDGPDPKYKNATCIDQTQLCPQGYDFSKSRTAERYNRMRDALLKQNRPIEYDICVGGEAAVYSWGNETGNAWRITTDIIPEWWSILMILNRNSFLSHQTNFWGHNDADMLEVGNGGLTLAESRSHFALWAAMKSPLFIGTPLPSIQPSFLEILLNKHLLAFNQDDLYGAPAQPYKWGHNPDWTFDMSWPAEYWSGKGKEGTLVLMLNTEEGSVEKSAVWGEVPELEEGKAYEVLDVWTGEEKGCVRGNYTVEVASHDTAVLLVKGECGASGVAASQGGGRMQLLMSP
ncbi:glycoside hydrolase family 27 protein [Periconia macrospinosa]|uniref:Alpha-galactosidase n=1 Tax=Periconia macrospinosa TaxID=97972 RepID=A0A2V1D8U9_9PLEO|nr:glycoside hydrolase family 27 protein [Periconia macrospinosa]